MESVFLTRSKPNTINNLKFNVTRFLKERKTNYEVKYYLLVPCLLYGSPIEI